MATNLDELLEKIRSGQIDWSSDLPTFGGDRPRTTSLRYVLSWDKTRVLWRCFAPPDLLDRSELDYYWPVGKPFPPCPVCRVADHAELIFEDDQPGLDETVQCRECGTCCGWRRDRAQTLEAWARLSAVVPADDRAPIQAGARDD